MSAAAPYIDALTAIARALWLVPDGEPVTWDVDRLPEQVARELEDLRRERARLVRLGRS